MIADLTRGFALSGSNPWARFALHTLRSWGVILIAMLTLQFQCAGKRSWLSLLICTIIDTLD